MKREATAVGIRLTTDSSADSRPSGIVVVDVTCSNGSATSSVSKSVALSALSEVDVVDGGDQQQGPISRDGNGPLLAGSGSPKSADERNEEGSEYMAIGRKLQHRLRHHIKNANSHERNARRGTCSTSTQERKVHSNRFVGYDHHIVLLMHTYNYPYPLLALLFTLLQGTKCISWYH